MRVKERKKERRQRYKDRHTDIRHSGEETENPETKETEEKKDILTKRDINIEEEKCIEILIYTKVT